MGNYVNNNLISDEQVELETTYYWIIFCSLRAVFTLFIAPLIDRYTDEFAITNKRVIIKTGLISRKTFEMNHSKIESIHIDQSILGRILGYGPSGLLVLVARAKYSPAYKSRLPSGKSFRSYPISSRVQ